MLHAADQRDEPRRLFLGAIDDIGRLLHRVLPESSPIVRLSCGYGLRLRR
jgi:hypothetical protein